MLYCYGLWNTERELFRQAVGVSLHLIYKLIHIFCNSYEEIYLHKGKQNRTNVEQNQCIIKK